MLYPRNSKGQTFSEWLESNRSLITKGASVMELKEAQDIIHAGLAWANWTDEQQAAMRVALKCIIKIEQIQKEAEELYQEEIDLSDFGERVMSLI